ncbi:hypothetical protein DVH24_036030 [Malus domestica]|uniref:Uncharacterized protein n=1 Tax=Malus domestica TaxID=3750 RepID=A0A498JV84_MALDO|nr:hypothetical protein DVH24_036030 [Malus domestica]
MKIYTVFMWAAEGEESSMVCYSGEEAVEILLAKKISSIFVTSHIDQRRGGDVPYMYMPTSIWHEVFWELTSFGFHRNSEVKRVRVRAFLGWVTH